MASQTTSSTPKKKLFKGGEGQNQAIPGVAMFVGHAFVLCKTSYISVEDLFPRCYTVWRSSTTRQILALSRRSRMMWNFASKTFSDVFWKQACISAISRCMFGFFDRTMEVIHFHLLYLFFRDTFVCMVPTPVKSSVLRWYMIQFSYDSVYVFNHWIKLQEDRGLRTV